MQQVIYDICGENGIHSCSLRSFKSLFIEFIVKGKISVTKQKLYQNDEMIKF